MYRPSLHLWILPRSKDFAIGHGHDILTKWNNCAQSFKCRMRVLMKFSQAVIEYADPSRESRLPGQSVPYVPRDEAFEPIKQNCYMSTALRGLVQQRLPDLRDHFRGSLNEFDSFDEIDQLYSAGVQIKDKSDPLQNALENLRDLPMFSLLPDTVKVLVNAVADQPKDVFHYPQPQIHASKFPDVILVRSE